MAESLHIYLFISSILLSLGIFAVITRTNAVAILMGIELILNSANINFIAFNRFGDFKILDGHIFSVFVIVLAAAEAAVALAIIINLFKNTGTVKVDEARELKG
jgi:NADH:ubiquinone oxidoreductase subunit K|tara:strand:- start:21 stop:332 length:312 start_codon:yes stop_codon:yes gene_type:complete